MTTARSSLPLPGEHTQQGRTTTPRTLLILTVLALLGVAFGVYMALGFAGTDLEQGNVQRVFYIHMGAFFGAFVAFGATTLGGIQYLRSRDVRWDTLALAGVEVGLVLAIINIATGSIWARPIWNTWWNWDPRLTSAAIMILTYAAYLMLRAGIDNPEQRRRFASIYGVFAIATVILTLIIPRIVPSSIHPIVIGPVFNGTEAFVEGDFQLAATSGVAVALLINMAVWTLLVPIVLIWHRIRLENDAQRIHARKAALLERES
jgi:heme exporter protein C